MIYVNLDYIPDLLISLLDIKRFFCNIASQFLPKKREVITMVCQTVKKGMECFFMSQKGCQFNGGACYSIIEQCEGCQRIQELSTGRYCLVFPDPAAKWRLGPCNMATHLRGNDNKKQNRKLNPLKASKRRR